MSTKSLAAATTISHTISQPRRKYPSDTRICPSCGGEKSHRGTLCRACTLEAKRRTPETIAETFWGRVDRSTGPESCWPYQGARFWFGHGAVKVDGRPWGTHRVAWELTNGPIPEGLVVCHRCDNPPCCNPAHLFLGTAADNARDMWAKGRGFRRSTNKTA